MTIFAGVHEARGASRAKEAVVLLCSFQIPVPGGPFLLYQGAHTRRAWSHLPLGSVCPVSFDLMILRSSWELDIDQKSSSS